MFSGNSPAVAFPAIMSQKFHARANFSPGHLSAPDLHPASPSGPHLAILRHSALPLCSISRIPMSDPMVTTILSALESVRGEYYRLVFVGQVAEPNLLTISRISRYPLINLSLEMSRLLMAVPPAQRARNLTSIAEDLVHRVGAEGVILNRLELLFLPSLSHDPVRTLLQLSRELSILAVWPGEMDRDRLRYAEPTHPEHRDYDALDLVVVKPAFGAHAVTTE